MVRPPPNTAENPRTTPPGRTSRFPKTALPFKLLSAIKDVKVYLSCFDQQSHRPPIAMISQTVEYALRAVVTIAQHDGVPCTAQQISQITQVPGPYLSKLLQGLVREGIVSSQRGLHGGFVLTKEPSKLTIWEVTDAVEPFQRIRECPLGIKSHRGGLCSLHKRLDAAMATVEVQFRSTTIADILADTGDATPLCQDRKTIMIRKNIENYGPPTTFREESP